MPFTIPTGSINDILTTYLPKILAIRYLTVAGLTIAAWDYLIAFPIELRVIWQNDSQNKGMLSNCGVQWYALKAAYLFNRAAVIAFLAFYLDMATAQRRLSTEWCVSVSILIAVGIMFVEAFGHGLALFRVFILWNRTLRIRYFLVAGTIAMYTVSAVFMVFFVRRIGDGAFYVGPPIRQCYVNINTKLLLGSLVPQVALDVYAVLLVFWNAMDRPRAASERILEILSRDGLFLMLVTFGLRTLNICLIASSGEFQAIIALSFIQAVTTTINARLFLMLYDSQYLTSGESDTDAMDQESDIPTVRALAGTGSPLSPYFKSRAKKLLQHQRSDSFARSDTGSIASGEVVMKPRSRGSDGDGTCVLAVDAVGPDMEPERESESDVRMQTANGWYAMLNLRPSSSRSIG